MRFNRFLLAGVILFVLAFVAVLGGADPSSASFNPTLKLVVANTTPETPSDFTADFGVPIGDVNFAGVVSFIPSDWGIVKGTEIPVGADVGKLTADSTLGLIGSPCNQAVPVEFEMKNGSLDRTDTVSFQDKDLNNTGDYADDKDKNGMYDAVDKYPDFLNRLWDIQPVRRAVGISPVASIPVLLEFLVFPPGTLINENIPNDKSLGFPSVTVLQNIGDPNAVPAPSAITDFCSPLASTNISYGKTPDGKTLSVNPQSGEYTFTTVTIGLRDADGDGYENLLDTCPLTVNKGDPREPNSGDADSDGLDAACDPNDNPATGGTNSDQDGDGYLNRQDNCPLVANGQDLDNQKDTDLDQIGDACDPNPKKADGELAKALPQVKIKIGTGTGAGGPPRNCPTCQPPDKPPDVPVKATIVKPDGGDGISTGAVIGIIVGVAAAVIVIGGGAAFMMRRKSS